MRSLSFFLLSLTFLSTIVRAEMRVNVQNDFVYTSVDISEAMGIPEKKLVDWDNFNYKGFIQILFKKSENISYGPEFGFNRLTQPQAHTLHLWLVPIDLPKMLS